MKNSEVTSSPSQVEFEKEIREIYRERNAKHFAVPAGIRHKPPHQRGELVIILLLALLVSLITSVITVSLIEPAVSWPIIQPGDRTVISSAPLDLSDEVKDNLRKSVVSLFPTRPLKADNLVEAVYLVSESLGQGLVLSSDGWIVTTTGVVANAKQMVNVAAADGSIYPTELMVFDPVLPLVYLKIKATNLTATAFASISRLTPGQVAVVLAATSQSPALDIYWRRLANLAAVSVAQRSELVFSSEIVPERILLDQPLPALLQGAPLANLQGEVIGLVVNFQGSLKGVIPLEYLTSIIDSLFTTQQVKRPALGINYWQSLWSGPLMSAAKTPSRGAQIISYAGRSGVVPKSVAARAELEEGDVIVNLNGEQINQRTLSAMLQQYRAGAKVELDIIREGQTKKINLILDSLIKEAVSFTAKK